VSTIEFFRPESQRPLDADGFEVDCATRLAAELEAIEPVSPAFEPTEADRQWAVANIDTDQDEAWADYREWAEHVDRLEAISQRQFTDEDLRSAGLAVG
jgi:hypothetical protein